MAVFGDLALDTMARSPVSLFAQLSRATRDQHLDLKLGYKDKVQFAANSV